MSSTDVSTSSSTDAVPTYIRGGNPDPRFTDYYPAWLDNLANDVTIEGSLLDGAAQGTEAVRAIVVGIRALYGDSQEFNFAGSWGDNGWLEFYTAEVRGEPVGCVVLVTRNLAGQTQHIAANYRPRRSLLLLSRLVGEKLAGIPYAKYFLTSESLIGRTDRPTDD
jgi:hypothetical protein